MNSQLIANNVKLILNTLPPDVKLVAAVKSRTVEEVQAAIQAGVTCIGHNYVREARRMASAIENDVEWHMIGHLQRNKVNKASQIFDMIESLDSLRLAQAINKRCARDGTTMPVLI